MSIKKSFAGSTIRKPGAYSQDMVSNSAGTSLGADDVIFIVGESSKGAPGSVEGIQQFPTAALNTLVAKYGSGPLVDCAVAACAPAKAGQNIGAPSTIFVWKTNGSTDAQVLLKKSTSPIFNVLDDGFGAAGNALSIILGAGDSADQKQVSVAQLGGTTETLGENAANDILTVQYTGNGTAATAAINGSSQNGKLLTTVLTGQTDSSLALSIQLKNYTMATLVAFINMQPGYTAALNTPSASQMPATQLDPIAAADMKTAGLALMQLQNEILAIINSSARVNAVLQDTPVIGLPDNGQFALSGGAQGASANSDFSTGFLNSLAIDYNCALAAISRDASDDIADVNQGFTDPASSYTVESVQVALDQHLQLRGDVKNRKEAQGFGGVRKQTKAAAYAFAQTIGDYLMQMFIQDALILDSTGTLRYMHPHVVAAMAMGARCGQAVGEPLTFKYLNVQQIGHFINPLTGLATGDFNPGVDYDEAIDAGVTFMESAQGGYRIVVDNTTYGVDDSFVYNRGSVIQACQYVDRTLRQVAETIFIGHKVSNGAASSIKSAIRNSLRTLNQPDVNIITSSADAPEGFREDTFVVTIVGNTATVQVEYKPVQGLDFVFFEFTLGDIQQTA